MLYLQKLILVSREQLTAHCLRLALLAAGFDCEAVDPASSPSVLERVATERPALVLLDPDRLSTNGTALLTHFRSHGAAVLILTRDTKLETVATYIALGALGWVYPSMPFVQVVETIRKALRGERLLAPAEQMELIGIGRRRLSDETRVRAAFASLTPRERHVLTDLVRGHTAQEIARGNGLSLATVRTYIRAILSKIGVSSQLAAVALCREFGLVGSTRPWEDALPIAEGSGA